MSDLYQSLSHSKWDCKYHVVFIPKYRRKALYHELRRHLGEVFRALAEQKECRIEEGHLMADHVQGDRILIPCIDVEWRLESHLITGLWVVDQ